MVFDFIRLIKSNCWYYNYYETLLVKNKIKSRLFTKVYFNPEHILNTIKFEHIFTAQVWKIGWWEYSP